MYKLQLQYKIIKCNKCYERYQIKQDQVFQIDRYNLIDLIEKAGDVYFFCEECGNKIYME